MARPTALHVAGVTKRFGRVVALDEVSFDVPARSIFGLLGPNGAGKTTLLSIVAGFLRADAGAIRCLDVDVREIARLQGRLTILPQDALFQRNVPIVEQLTFFRLLDGRPREAAEREVRETLERVGLGEFMNRRVHALSHGMVKRLGIAQAFLGEPEVILLDEPTSGLDPKNARQIRDLVREFGTRATVVLSSHNLAEVQELCDHVAILDRGRVVAAGSVAELTARAREIELELSRELAEGELAALAALPGVESLRRDGPARYEASIRLAESDPDADAVLRALLRAVLDLGVTPRRVAEGSTLEELFLSVTGRQPGEAGEADGGAAAGTTRARARAEDAAEAGAAGR